jgi:hypothetical protein
MGRSVVSPGTSVRLGMRGHGAGDAMSTEGGGDGGISSVCRFGWVLQGVPSLPWRRLGPRWEGGPRLAVATVNAGVGLGVGRTRNHRPCRRLGPSWVPPGGPGGNLAVPEAADTPRKQNPSHAVLGIAEALPIRLGKCPQKTASIVGKCSRPFHTRANHVASERCTDATEEFRQNR